MLNSQKQWKSALNARTTDHLTTPFLLLLTTHAPAAKAGIEGIVHVAAPDYSNANEETKTIIWKTSNSKPQIRGR
jgi:hypothetical protein